MRQEIVSPQMLRRISLFTLELKLHNFIQALERRYNPNWPTQPRVPAGEAIGPGRWTAGGDGGTVVQLADETRQGSLVGQRIGFGDDKVVRHCYYENELGIIFTVEQDAIEECPPIWPIGGPAKG